MIQYIHNNIDSTIEEGGGRPRMGRLIKLHTVKSDRQQQTHTKHNIAMHVAMTFFVLKRIIQKQH
jgi:hypothetical protein